MLEWVLHPLEADAVIHKRKIPLQRRFDAWEKEMDWHGKRHPLFERMHHGGNVIWPHVRSWWSTHKAWSWESQVYIKYVAEIHKNSTRKSHQYTNRNVWERAEKTTILWTDYCTSVWELPNHGLNCSLVPGERTQTALGALVEVIHLYDWKVSRLPKPHVRAGCHKKMISTWRFFLLEYSAIPWDG